jgi:hypothetical protein
MVERAAARGAAKSCQVMAVPARSATTTRWPMAATTTSVVEALAIAAHALTTVGARAKRVATMSVAARTDRGWWEARSGGRHHNGGSTSDISTHDGEGHGKGGVGRGHVSLTGGTHYGSMRGGEGLDHGTTERSRVARINNRGGHSWRVGGWLHAGGKTRSRGGELLLLDRWKLLLLFGD